MLSFASARTTRISESITCLRSVSSLPFPFFPIRFPFSFSSDSSAPGSSSTSSAPLISLSAYLAVHSPIARPSAFSSSSASSLSFSLPLDLFLFLLSWLESDSSVPTALSGPLRISSWTNKNKYPPVSCPF
ncbi:hypothetical protein Goarm_020963 [Gossypium armourianum]|uniref:Uncharacterized protein n=1 Tax=Gossypium armourianum TaxID=34283 RepID=A0A7J9IQ70_9ROSI|nr:hypothetical protein [Gossypium armourianum]